MFKLLVSIILPALLLVLLYSCFYTNNYRVIKIDNRFKIERRYRLFGWKNISGRGFTDEQSAINIYNYMIKKKSSNFDIIVSSTDNMKSKDND